MMYTVLKFASIFLVIGLINHANDIVKNRTLSGQYSKVRGVLLALSVDVAFVTFFAVIWVFLDMFESFTITHILIGIALFIFYLGFKAHTIYTEAELAEIERDA